jgi:hypothetical protein
MGRQAKLGFFIMAASLLGLSTVVDAQMQAGGAFVPRGVMSFGWAENFVDTKSMDMPYISGMTAYTGWSSVEKEEGVYDFRALDQLIGMAKAKGKIINIMFSPGMHAPEWLYRKGAKAYSWDSDFPEDQWYAQGKSKIIKAPVSWDPVFLDYWKRFITKIAEKYGSEPAVGYISLTGPVIRGLTATIPVKHEADWRRFLESGYSEDKMMKAWIDVIDHHYKVLPNKRLVLGLAPDRIGRVDIERSKAMVRYIMEKKYNNIAFIVVCLNDTWYKRGNLGRGLRDLLRLAKANGYSFGYQMAQSANRNAKWRRKAPIVNNLKDSFAIAIEDGASWIEVWHDDIIDPAGRAEGRPNARYVADLRWAHDNLLTGGPR